MSYERYIRIDMQPLWKAVQMRFIDESNAGYPAAKENRDKAEDKLRQEYHRRVRELGDL